MNMPPFGKGGEGGFSKRMLFYDKQFVIYKISPCPSLPSGPEALWAGGQRGEKLKRIFLGLFTPGVVGFLVSEGGTDAKSD